MSRNSLLQPGAFRTRNAKGIFQSRVRSTAAFRTVFTVNADGHYGSFYDDNISAYLRGTLAPVSLKELLRFGKPPLSTKKLIESSEWARQELPLRLAQRMRALQNLPFIVGTNPHIRNVYQLYRRSFETMRNFPKVEDEKGDEEFTEVLASLIESHADVIPTLARGFQEAKRYMSKQDTTAFLDDMIHARIGIRLLAEQHVALHQPREHYIGIIDTALKPAIRIRDCADFVRDLCEIHYGSAPELIVNGDLEMNFAYVPVHLEYILSEVLKNSFRATVEYSNKINRSPHPPIEVTVSKGQADIAIRVRDEGGGVAPEDLQRIFEYSYTTVSRDDSEAENGSFSSGAAAADNNIFFAQSQMAMQTGVGGPIAGLGFGLPLARIYAKYFGGSMELIPLHRYGTDVFLSLRNLDLGSLSPPMETTLENNSDAERVA